MDPDWRARLAERLELAAPELQSLRRTMLERLGGGDVNIVLATGYGLSGDGLWRPHSWLIEPQNDGPARIVETTVGRLAYFGYVMDLPQSVDFVFGGTPADLREEVLQMLRGKPVAAALAP